MAYLDRLQPQIVLISPSGIEFSAKWAGNVRSLEKEIGIFKTPGVRGIISQDLDVRGEIYPLTFFFDGPDNDLEANSFFEACKENGEWSVVHPVHGTKTLQLITVSESVQPVSSGNLTEITSEWIEVSEEKGTKSAAQLSSETISQNVELEQTASDQIDKITSFDTADKTQRFKVAVGNVVTAFDNTLQNLTSTVGEVQAQADSIKRGIDSALLESPLDVLSLAGQIQALISLPNLIETDLTSKVSTYQNFVNSIFTFLPEEDSVALVNAAAVYELALVSTIGSVGVASVSSDLSSRSFVIDSIEANSSLFNSITTELDNVQELYSGNLISRSYFSQSDSFADSARLLGLTLAYLIKSIFDLSVEKRIVLTQQENPIIIAMREYSGPGEDDDNINLFISSNKLTGQEILLLPQGKEVVVYL